jgi:phosphoglycolate phosphatase-like HAD superfamily hydrolase
MSETNSDAIVDAAVAQIEASGAELSAEQAALSAERANEAVARVESEADLLQHQRHSELISGYENRIATLEASCQNLQEIHSLNQTALQEAMTRLELAEARLPLVVVPAGPENPTQPVVVQSTLEPLPGATGTAETLPLAEPEPPPAPARKKRRIL